MRAALPLGFAAWGVIGGLVLGDYLLVVLAVILAAVVVAWAMGREHG